MYDQGFTPEKAFFAALGSNQVIERYNKFFDEGPSTYGSKPMEQIISDVDNNVDRCFGRNSSNRQFRLGTKYGVIFQIAQNLPVELKQIKNHILQTAGTAIEKISEAKDVSEYMDTLAQDFETKGILHDYTKVNNHATKKKIGGNKGGVKH